MATPFFQQQTPSLAMNTEVPFSQFFPTLDASGNPINVSSGYTVQRAAVQVASLVNSLNTAIDVSSNATFTFSSTGVTMTASVAQADGLLAKCPSTQMTFQLVLSNDGGTTSTQLALCPFAVINPLSGT